jgi:hypothetical protein
MKYFFVYYMNLMFSALTAQDQRTVIDKCLDPLLGLADKGFKYGIQISGVSLEIIADYRPDLVTKLAGLIDENKIDFIGNGYAQIIQPLFPHELNCKNQLIGMETYKRYLNYEPKICTINEMAYSNGSCESILSAGYETILMEVNNVAPNIDVDNFDQFKSAKTQIAGNEFDVLWCDTIAFQKFQKYTHGEIDLDSYLDWLFSYTEGSEGSLCLYCSDAEIFGFRPARYGTEITPTLDEWERIERLMRRLQASTILPSASEKPSGKVIEITNAETPILVKKQQKYNINRWAVTGRNDQILNSFCYRLFNHAKGIGSSFSDSDWKGLLKLSSSDLRTHIEDQRWEEAARIKKKFEVRFAGDMNVVGGADPTPPSVDVPIALDRKRGNNIISWPNEYPMLGRVESGKFSKTSLMADFYSGYAVIEKLGHRKISDLDYESSLSNSQTHNYFTNESGYVIKKTIVSNDIESLQFFISIIVPYRTREQIKPCHFSLTSDHWDMDSLYYSAKLGGSLLEKFKFGTVSFNQDSILNLNVVGTNGFCPTDGVLIIGDKDKAMSFRLDQSVCFSLIRFTYDVDDKNRFLLRISFVVQDIDETFRNSEEKQCFDFHCTLSRIA